MDLGARLTAIRDAQVEAAAQRNMADVAAIAADVASATATDVASTTATDVANAAVAEVTPAAAAAAQTYVEDRIAQIVAANNLIDTGCPPT